MSQALRKLTAVISKSNCIVIFINQLREKIGVMYGNPETTPGGRALKFYASVRIDVRKGEAIKDGGNIVGAVTRCKVVKNKVAPPFKEAQFDLMYGSGISRTGELLDLAVELGIIKKGGSWFSYNDQKLGQGRDNVKEMLKNTPELMKEIEDQVMSRKDELDPVSKPEKKESTPAPAESPKETGSSSAPDEDILANIDEDFEEFTPADE